ncbi:hypothetical protein CDL12_05193 [Handroanthus impetiginosus]|uniref:Uncharacterized protein n=1 Tax=Handroanthus impetiginosus TaxID=429701 RepID=A0A2G9HX89_9LAMI|nr:hypothetical protein CDL12_05193 [Handroanthus impetiginosus]
MAVQSVTNQEIAYYWKRRRMVEEDHLYAALKAAARVRARNLSDYDYLQFQDSLKEDYESTEKQNTSKSFGEKEIRVGIKDWWTKSNYAYLNQPAMKMFDSPRRQYYTYLPQFFTCSSA